MQLKITMRNLEQVGSELKQLVRRVEDLGPVLAEFGIHMLRSIEQTFQAGGRPTAWPPSTRAIRTGGKTLIKTARLKNSITARVTGPRTLSLGSNVTYAAVHQLGFSGTVQVPEHIRRVRLAFGRKLRSPTYATVRAHVAQMRIPPRPYLVAQDEDLGILKDMLDRHIAGGA